MAIAVASALSGLGAVCVGELRWMKLSRTGNIPIVCHPVEVSRGE